MVPLLLTFVNSHPLPSSAERRCSLERIVNWLNCLSVNACDPLTSSRRLPLERFLTCLLRQVRGPSTPRGSQPRKFRVFGNARLCSPFAFDVEECPVFNGARKFRFNMRSTNVSDPSANLGDRPLTHLRCQMHRLLWLSRAHATLASARVRSRATVCLLSKEKNCYSAGRNN
jgi:hypothetical protein